MARKIRLEYAGACYHVINRGNYRRDLFAGKGAAESFQACLLETAARCGWRVHAFVVMRNHFHFAVETPEPNLSAGMQWLQGTWATRFNRFHREAGRPFQGRYKALHVEPGHALAQVAHYIHLNPVRARIVPAEELLKFSASSLPLFVRKNRPEVLIAETILAESGGLPDTKAGWKRHIAYLGVLAEEDPRRRGEKYGRLSRGWAIGSAEFKADLRKDLAQASGGMRRFELLGADREAHREVHAPMWEEKLQRAAKITGTGLDELPARKSALEKVRLAAVLKATTSVSNGWLADRLKMGEPASVSQFVRRFRLAGETERRGFRQIISELTS